MDHIDIQFYTDHFDTMLYGLFWYNAMNLSFSQVNVLQSVKLIK